ncbi:hydroxymethylglutaryl-CoA lyase [Enterovirga sp. CN4-39]|uniref:hydroxymethylglutaryl-CoA lyase n=1 Tax=Enterovirga sp. CN4-39 TaxID=3400910 RepID=UPI003C0DD9EE
MADRPKRVEIHEEGPREGFQIEPGPISTAAKVEFIEALAETGLREVQSASFVDPRRVPGWADADEVARAIRRRPDVRYTCIWLNQRGLERAVATPLDIVGSIQLSASETFSLRNTNRDTSQTLAEQRKTLDFCKARGIAVTDAIVMTAFGCNYEGFISSERVRECVGVLLDLAAEYELQLSCVRLADTMGWANPTTVERIVGTVRERWPDLRLGLHLHDTRGTGMANALAGLQMGIDYFDSSCAGLGGCPFAGHQSAAGNICTEDLVYMCEEMGIETGIDLERLIECARMAERIVGHPLPGKLMHAGSLQPYRARNDS